VRDVGMRAAISPPVAPLNAVRDSYLASEWHRVLTTFHDDWGLPENETAEKRFALLDRLCEAAVAIWAKPVRTWDDLVVRAAMAVHYNPPGRVGELAYPDNVLADGDEASADECSLAHVVRGILDLAGLKFDAEGQLT
jgi:hypothetical protein